MVASVGSAAALRCLRSHEQSRPTECARQTCRVPPPLGRYVYAIFHHGALPSRPLKLTRRWQHILTLLTSYGVCVPRDLLMSRTLGASSITSPLSPSVVRMVCCVVLLWCDEIDLFRRKKASGEQHESDSLLRHVLLHSLSNGAPTKNDM